MSNSRQRPLAPPDPEARRAQTLPGHYRVVYDANVNQTYSPPAQYAPNASLTPIATQAVYYPDTCTCSAAPTLHRHRPLARSYPSPHYDSGTSYLPNPVLDVPLIPSNVTTPIAPQTGVPDGPLQTIDPSFKIAPGALDKYANFIKLGSHTTIATNNLALINPKPVEWDGRWFKYVTSVPLKYGNVYLLDDAIPTLENVPDARKYDRADDRNGPPPGSRLHQMWHCVEDKCIEKVQSQDTLSTSDLQLCLKRYTENCEHVKKNVFQHVCFILRFQERQKLYETLFHRIDFDVSRGHCCPKDAYVETIMESKVIAIFYIESFLLMALYTFHYHFKIKVIPNLTKFVGDVYDIVDTFLTNDPIHPSKIKIDDLPKSVRLDQVTWWLDSDFSKNWETRWKAVGIRDPSHVIFQPSVTRNYVCALLDSMFGLWVSPGHCLFHSGYEEWTRHAALVPCHQDQNPCPEPHPYSHETSGRWALMEETIPRCIHDGLYFWEDPPPQPEVGSDSETTKQVEEAASVSLGPMDARLITARLPFKFESTLKLHEHLTFKSGEKETILIFTDWKRFLMLRHHKVLVDDISPDYPKDTVSLFQLLARSSRPADDRIGGKAVDVRGIAYELLQTYALLFYRKVTDEGGEFYHDAEIGWVRWMLGDCPSKSSEIGGALLGDLDEGESSSGFDQLVKILAHRDKSVPQSADFKIFRERLETLNRTFNNWKPSRPREWAMYEGWVGDETSIVNVYVALGALTFAMISIVVNVAELVVSIIKS